MLNQDVFLAVHKPRRARHARRMRRRQPKGAGIGLMAFMATVAVVQWLDNSADSGPQSPPVQACAVVWNPPQAQGNWLRVVLPRMLLELERRIETPRPSPRQPGLPPLLQVQFWPADAPAPVPAQDQPWPDGTRFQLQVVSATDGLLRMHSVNPAGQPSPVPLWQVVVRAGQPVASPMLRLQGQQGYDHLCLALEGKFQRTVARHQVPVLHL